jgi:MFS family permease
MLSPAVPEPVQRIRDVRTLACHLGWRDDPGSRYKSRVLAALRIRDFRLLWSARLVSALGTWLLVIAVPAHVFQLTGSLLATGLTLAAEYLPVLLLGPLAGVLTDRWDRRRLMIATDLLRAGAVALLILVRSADLVWIVYLALAAESAASVLFRPAAQAHTPAVVGTGRQLSSANALNAVTDGTVRLIGGPLGAAVLIWLGFTGLVLLDVASYLVSALVIAVSSGVRRAAPGTPNTLRQLGRDLADGWRSLRGDPMVRGLLPVTVVFLTANASLSALLVPFAVTELGGQQPAGFLVSALGVGFLLGAPLIRVLIDRARPAPLLTLTLLATAAGFALLFSSTVLAPALVAAVLIGVAGSMALVIPPTVLQRALPDAVLGRVSAVFFTGEALATLIGAVAGPSLAGYGGVRLVMWVACAGTVAAAALSAVLLPRTATPVPSAGQPGAAAPVPSGAQPGRDPA